MITNIATPGLRFRNTQTLKNSLANTSHYVFVSDFIPHSNVILQDLHTNINDTLVDVYKKLIFGKKIANTDVSYLIRSIPWLSGTMYTMYDDQDDLENKDFFVQVHEGSFYHTWKCLDNNNGATSTSQPTFASGATVPLYQTADGYRWRYLATVDDTTYNKFVTPDHVPVVANSSVAAAAIGGAFDVIKVINQGSLYNNCLDGTLRNSQLKINGDPTLYAISNSVIVAANGYYTGCIIYLSTGTGQGQYRKIIDYVANSTGDLIRLESAWTVDPTSGTTWQIRPSVVVTPIQDNPVVNCVARALVNATNSNSVYRIEILERGQGYVAATANVIANAIVAVSNTAVLRPINAPYGGHGNWPYQELYVDDLEVSVSLANSIGNTVPAWNQFQQIGVIRDPLFANVNFQLTANQGNFSVGEKVTNILSEIRLNANVTVITSAHTVSCNAANWPFETVAGAQLHITNQGATLNLLATVNNVINATHINITTNCTFACTEAIVYAVTVGSNADVIAVSSGNNIFMSNVSSSFIQPSKLIGQTSGAYGVVNTINRNDEAKDFSTFVDLHKYTATLQAGSFIQNEVVSQGSNTGYYHSLTGSNNSVLYLCNFSNLAFDLGQIIGSQSLAIANITKTYDRELVDYTGEVLYVENTAPVIRANNQTETIQIVFNY